MKMGLSLANIYPMNSENLRALLDHYFPYYPLGHIHKFTNLVNKAGFTLKELEYTTERLLPHVQFIKQRTKTQPSQTNLLDYSIEIFLSEDWDSSEKSPDRYAIINSIKKNAGVIDQVSQKNFEDSGKYYPPYDPSSGEDFPESNGDSNQCDDSDIY